MTRWTSPCIIAWFALGALCSCKPESPPSTPGTAGTQPVADVPEELRVFENLGTWKYEITSRKAIWTPEEKTESGMWFSEFALGNRWLMSRSYTADGKKMTALELVGGYDKDRRVYRRWVFREFANRSEGTYDEANKAFTFTWEIRDGIRGTFQTKRTGPKTRESSLTAKDAGGKLYLDSVAKATRQDTEMTPHWDSDPAANLPPETDELKRFLGDWTGEATIKMADEKESKLSGGNDGRWILGGRYLLIRGRNNENDKRVMQLMTFDTSKQAYRLWYFDSAGVFDEWSGKWDAAAKTFTLESTWPGGVMATNTVRFPDENSHEWNLIAKDADGKVVVEMSGKSVRKK